MMADENNQNEAATDNVDAVAATDGAAPQREGRGGNRGGRDGAGRDGGGRDGGGRGRGRRNDRKEQQQEEVEYHRVIVWSQSAEYCGKYLTKGNKVLTNI